MLDPTLYVILVFAHDATRWNTDVSGFAELMSADPWVRRGIGSRPSGRRAFSIPRVFVATVQLTVARRVRRQN